MGKYGIPYQGSKGRIADALIRVLPSGKRFVDLFGGGGAMTHCAALSGKYERVLYNEIQPNLVKLMRDAVEGKYSYDVFTPEWISREEFFARKEDDAYVKYIWSFSNTGTRYIFGQDREEWKHSAHNLVVFGIVDTNIESFQGLKEAVTERGIHERRLQWRAYFTAHNDRFDLQQLEALERLQQLEALKIKQGDYREYEYKEGDVVYCDPPYEGARGYDGKPFDFDEFYEWAVSRDFPVYFSNYDKISDKRVLPVWATEKDNLMSQGGGGNKVDEILYVNRPVDFRFNNYAYVKAQREQKQISLFDKGGDE